MPGTQILLLEEGQPSCDHEGGSHILRGSGAGPGVPDDVSSSWISYYWLLLLQTFCPMREIRPLFWLKTISEPYSYLHHKVAVRKKYETGIEIAHFMVKGTTYREMLQFTSETLADE